jgi:hypothetical protein
MLRHTAEVARALDLPPHRNKEEERVRGLCRAADASPRTKYTQHSLLSTSLHKALNYMTCPLGSYLGQVKASLRSDPLSTGGSSARLGLVARASTTC